MATKHWLLVASVVVLGGVSLYLNRDYFAKDDIHIFHVSRPLRTGFGSRKRAEASPVTPVLFEADRKIKITSLKVIPISDIQTNKYPHPIWSLVSDSNSVPVNEFYYGAPIRGMHAQVKDAVAYDLEPGVSYRLTLEVAGGKKADHDFVPIPATQ